MFFDCSVKCSMQKLSPYIVYTYCSMLISRNPIVSISVTLIFIVVYYLCYKISQLKAVAWLSLRTRIWFMYLSTICYSLSSSYDSLNNTFRLSYNLPALQPLIQIIICVIILHQQCRIIYKSIIKILRVVYVKQRAEKEISIPPVCCFWDTNYGKARQILVFPN